VNVRSWSPKVKVERSFAAGALLLAVLGPVIFSPYWAHNLITETFFYGIAASSLIFLFAYGGMISLAQTALYAIAGFILGNLVTHGGPGGTTKGLHLGWDPTLAIIVAILGTTLIGLIMGAVAARSTGIYFLMITLTYGVIGTYFFGQVTKVSGFSGIGGINLYTPGWIGSILEHPNRLYYVALATSIVVYVLIRYVLRTPFGISLQGVRDEPVRMSSLGYNVALHRALAFCFGAFIASLSGILYVWWAGTIAPDALGLGATINLLIMAVIGGLRRIEGAWIGAFAFIVINDQIRTVTLPGIGGSFNSIIGLIFLAIVVVSPDGLMGIWERIARVAFRGPRGGATAVDASKPAPQTGS
jgi:branched-chain amino acid transport system permease protein